MRISESHTLNGPRPRRPASPDARLIRRHHFRMASMHLNQATSSTRGALEDIQHAPTWLALALHRPWKVRLSMSLATMLLVSQAKQEFVHRWHRWRPSLPVLGLSWGSITSLLFIYDVCNPSRTLKKPETTSQPAKSGTKHLETLHLCLSLGHKGSLLLAW
jgi:hypothetical protein